MLSLPDLFTNAFKTFIPPEFKFFDHKSYFNLLIEMIIDHIFNQDNVLINKKINCLF